jgi:hypothetical protein
MPLRRYSPRHRSSHVFFSGVKHGTGWICGHRRVLRGRDPSERSRQPHQAGEARSCSSATEPKKLSATGHDLHSHGAAWRGASDLACIRRDERVEHFETIRQRKDGSLIDISLTISPVKNPDWQIIGVWKIARNIAERRRQRNGRPAPQKDGPSRQESVCTRQWRGCLERRCGENPGEVVIGGTGHAGHASEGAPTDAARTLWQRFLPGQSTTTAPLIETILFPYEGQTDNNRPRFAVSGPGIPLWAAS